MIPDQIGIRTVTCENRERIGERLAERPDDRDQQAAERRFARRVGCFSIGARAVIFGVIGRLVVRAAMEADPPDAQGLGHALEMLYRQERGPWLLGFVSLGLVCYGLYCFVNARYRRVDV